MTAEQLAEQLECFGENVLAGESPFTKHAAMLRQQQAEYYSLLVNHDKLYAKVIEQQAEIEALKANTLTDEEINKIYLEKYDGHMGFLNPDEVRDFARAILRKAQE